ncbi:hypothetical protein EV356DRAFT_486498 [Viridothelium virens]|uniref:P-loop containing nucleoside triphosphate hydrolase protein n=1 Tax=Viridothelium virens TaxID=1048519 RepID=A0A6A6H7X1_VIRVR|nr:hypothetical protein EV356DRAFT_486498 [Viridothelium virens]
MLIGGSSHLNVGRRQSTKTANEWYKMTGRGGRGAYYKSLYGGRGRGRGRGQAVSAPANSSAGPKNWSDLKQILANIDRQQYGAYNQLRGQFLHPELGFKLAVDYVQGDAYAPPSRVRAIAELNSTGIPSSLLHSRVRRIAFADYLTRIAAHLIQDSQLNENAAGAGWSGPKGGAFRINGPGQQVLERNSCVIKLSENTIELRFTVSLPAQGRTILGGKAQQILLDAVPELVQRTLHFSSLSSQDVESHVSSVEEQDYLRSQLKSRGLVAFVANGSVLPRAGGPFARPMTGPKVIPFEIDSEHEVSLSRLNGQSVCGLGIPTGVTVLSGGGFHGKSTLLEAIELGIYNHIPRDGRELVVTDPTAVKIRAEDGRNVHQTDISPYIINIPGGQDTRQFTTGDASGSTSMAANIQEALEVGCKTLLIDEDSSATNLLIRDERMHALVQNEPITPMISRVRALKEDYDTSTIIVIGGLGDWLSVADNVIVMNSYCPRFRNDEARLICQNHPSELQIAERYGNLPNHSFVVPSAVLASKGPFAKRKDFILIPGLDQPILRTSTDAESGIDLSSIEQLVETGQSRLLAAILGNIAKGKRPVTFSQLLPELSKAFEDDGLDKADPSSPIGGDWVWTRGIEVAAMLCRLRGVQESS